MLPWQGRLLNVKDVIGHMALQLKNNVMILKWLCVFISTALPSIYYWLSSFLLITHITDKTKYPYTYLNRSSSCTVGWTMGEERSFYTPQKQKQKREWGNADIHYWLHHYTWNVSSHLFLSLSAMTSSLCFIFWRNSELEIEHYTHIV